MLTSTRLLYRFIEAGVVSLTFSIIECARADDFTPFTEEAQQRGVDFMVQPIYVTVFGHGVAFADLDNDGDPDLLAVGGTEGLVGVWENDGTGQFIDHSSASGITPREDFSAITAADYDNDGDVDLYLSAWASEDVLYRNDGNFQFTNVTSSAQLGSPGAGVGVGWGDYNNDGWLDFHLANRTNSTMPDGSLNVEPNRFYHNNGDGTFTEMIEQVGFLDYDAPSFQGTFFDYDRDGKQDLYLSNDKGVGCVWENRLWRNIGGTFIDVSKESNADVCLDAMCVAVGDFDGNGFQDVYITDVGPTNALLLNDGNGAFIESATLTGTQGPGVGWASQFFDFDNDGHMELFVCNQGQPNLLYRHAGQGFPCEEIASQLHLDDDANSFSASLADVDNDGDLDLAVLSTQQRLRLYINNEGHTRNWLKVRLLDELGRDMPGAIVKVDTGDAMQMREVVYNAGYKSQNELTRHFGLGDAQSIQTLSVIWPNGSQRTLTDVAPNQTLTFFIDCPQDINADGLINVADLVHLLASWGATGGSADLNDDGVVNVPDLLNLLGGWGPCQ